MWNASNPPVYRRPPRATLTQVFVTLRCSLYSLRLLIVSLSFLLSVSLLTWNLPSRRWKNSKLMKIPGKVPLRVWERPPSALKLYSKIIGYHWILGGRNVLTYNQTNRITICCIDGNDWKFTWKGLFCQGHAELIVCLTVLHHMLYVTVSYFLSSLILSQEARVPG